MTDNNRLQNIEADLDSFDSAKRKVALSQIAELISFGELIVPDSKPEVNLHFHTFFSFNANSWSPSRIAWESKKYGLAAAGVVDFDVLDGMEEFLSGGLSLNMPVCASMETRVFVGDYADKVMTSPNEPGITYFMAGGCYKLPSPDSPAEKQLSQMREMAKQRNLLLLGQVNAFLGAVQLDYDLDVAPLTPSGNVTERHILAAYDAKSREVFFGDHKALVSFWAGALEISRDDAEQLVDNEPKFHDSIRNKLMKFGGVGYIAPSKSTFPDIEPVIKMIQDMQALPTATWLDGTNPGEQDMPGLLEMLDDKGITAMNIIPDRNWNIKNPEEKALKIKNLGSAVESAKDRCMPLCVGTEMNKAGLPFVDNFHAPELQPYITDFISGAHFFWGHTLMARYANAGYASPWAENAFDNRQIRVEFYTRIGRGLNHIQASTLLEPLDVASMTAQQITSLLGC